MVRVTKNQHERVKNNAEAKGYKTISSYIRSMALEQGLSFEKKFEEIYNELITSKEEKGKLKKNP